MMMIRRRDAWKLRSKKPGHLRFLALVGVCFSFEFRNFNTFYFPADRDERKLRYLSGWILVDKYSEKFSWQRCNCYWIKLSWSSREPSKLVLHPQHSKQTGFLKKFVMWKNSNVCSSFTCCCFVIHNMTPLMTDHLKPPYAHILLIKCLRKKRTLNGRMRSLLIVERILID